MRHVRLRSGQAMPVLGLGTWRFGERRQARAAEVAAVRLGLDLGMTLIDTAEMYGEGGAEEVVGEAIAGRREEVFLVSKVYPQNASRTGAIAACERSLKRLGTDRLDLYLLHWRGAIPLAETVEAFATLVRHGKIASWGVSNLDEGDMGELWGVAGGAHGTTNQILYNLTRRGAEWGLLPWCRAHQVAIMAYSPIEQGRMLGNPALGRLAAARGVTPAQLALAWLLHQPDTVVIPKAGRAEHLRENAASLDIALGAEEMAALDKAFPPPRAKRPLEML